MTFDISLAKLVDLAIGTPEVGNVDFTTLHTLLHIIIRKLGSQKSSVELLPDHQEKLDPLLPFLDKDPTLQVTVRQDEGHEVFQVHPYRTDIEKEVVRSCISVENVQQISSKLEDLERVVSILPSEEQLQQYLSSRESLKQDETVDFLNLATRIDAIEIGLGKLTTLANDLLIEFSRLEKLVVPYLDGGDITAMKTQIDNINHLLAENYPGFCSRRVSDPQRASRRLTINTLPSDFYNKGVPTIAQITGPAARRSTGLSSRTRSFSSIVVSEQLEKEIECIKSVLNGLIGLLPLPDGTTGSELVVSGSDLSCGESQPQMKTNFHQKAASAIINLRSVQKEIDEIFQEKEERLIFMETAHKELVAAQQRLIDEMVLIREQLAGIDTMQAQFKLDNANNIDELRSALAVQLEQITKNVEYLKNDTVGRIIELEVQIEDRVDFALFRTRVPMETFETTVATVNQALEDAATKLDTCRSDLLRELSNLVAQLCEKVDRKELSSFEAKVSKKLALLQLRLNKFMKLQESIEAAGTKLKFAGDLTCISCDHDATMKALEDVVPKGKQLRAKTFYPYEMDGVLEARKNRNCGGPHTTVSLRKPVKTSAQRLCEARELVNQIKKRSLDLGLNIVQPEKPVYKIHL